MVFDPDEGLAEMVLGRDASSRLAGEGLRSLTHKLSLFSSTPRR